MSRAFHIVFLLVFIAILIMFILIFALAIETIITNTYGREIQIIEECKTGHGQTIIGSECERQTTCLDNSFLLKNCEQIRYGT